MSACKIQKTASIDLFSHCTRWTLRVNSGHHLCWQSALAHYAILPAPFLFKKERNKQTDKQMMGRRGEKGKERGKEEGRKSLKKKTNSVPYFMYLCLSLCMCIKCVQVPKETRRGHQIPWHWKHRRLEALVWLLGIKLGSFPTKSNKFSINCWVLSPAPFYFFKYL